MNVSQEEEEKEEIIINCFNILVLLPHGRTWNAIEGRLSSARARAVVHFCHRQSKIVSVAKMHENNNNFVYRCRLFLLLLVAAKVYTYKLILLLVELESNAMETITLYINIYYCCGHLFNY